MLRPIRCFTFALLSSLLATVASAAGTPKPLRVLLITGGCCHDYEKQKDILKTGLEQRANVVVEHLHSADKTVKPPLASLTNASYAAGYDLVIHDECAAGIDDPALVQNVLAPHQAGLPAVVLHCAMHSFRVVPDFARPQAPGSPGAIWFDFLGLQSSRHGPKQLVTVKFTDRSHPITKGLPDWTTGPEELYNNVQPPTVYPTHRSLATGHQTVTTKAGQKSDEEAVVVWAHEYGPKRARVFGTTLGHFNEAVSDPRYLDLVARGLLWAAGKLGADGQPVAGYGPAKR
jgi:hypothetical protein